MTYQAIVSRAPMALSPDEAELYIAACPALCVEARGDTQEVALTSLRRAMADAVRTLRENGQPMPLDRGFDTLDMWVG